jgi:hypothetical protein
MLMILGISFCGRFSLFYGKLQPCPVKVRLWMNHTIWIS